MGFLNQAVDFAMSPTGAAIMGGLFVLSESLAQIPAVRANSVFQLFQNVLRRFAPKQP